ncbi:MAG: flagellar FlbD family protein [Actinomycetia bacterium]|jgi:flagellar protein FlbD|nr:flagellar FlbD family protein [Actinomycetes bacterium]
MIPLHRLTHPEHPIHVNPDLIQTVESTPDTVVTMTNHAKLVVAESAEEVTDLICAWRASIVTRGLGIPELLTPELAQVLPFGPRGD